MTMTRCLFMARAASAGSLTILPFSAGAGGHGGDVFDTPRGPIAVHPVSHASMVLQTPMGTLYVDPVGDLTAYEGVPAPDAVLITHSNGDLCTNEVVTAINAEDTPILTNQIVLEGLPKALQANTTALVQGNAEEILGITVEATPAQPVANDRTTRQSMGSEDGFVLSIDGFRIFVAGNIQGVPDMQVLQDIDLAFVCMNMPVAMDASAVPEPECAFAPSRTLPNRDAAHVTRKPSVPAGLIGDVAEKHMGKWHGDGHTH